MERDTSALRQTSFNSIRYDYRKMIPRIFMLPCRLSIPSGTITGESRLTLFDVVVDFQFHQVRLPAGSTIRTGALHYRLSIPSGTITGAKTHPRAGWLCSFNSIRYDYRFAPLLLVADLLPLSIPSGTITGGLRPGCSNASSRTFNSIRYDYRSNSSQHLLPLIAFQFHQVRLPALCRWSR